MKKTLQKRRTRHITSYILFCMENRPIVKGEFPLKKPKDVTKELAKRWRELTLETKDGYRKQASDRYYRNENKDENDEENKSENVTVSDFIAILPLLFMIYQTIQRWTYDIFNTSTISVSTPLLPIIHLTKYINVSNVSNPLPLPLMSHTSWFIWLVTFVKNIFK